MLDIPHFQPRPVFLERIGMDEDALPFLLLQQGQQEGLRGTLVTLVHIQGGSPRALGTQMAVLEDGRYCGYISGGCLEASVASEAIRIMRQGRDETIRFGAGSRFIDIRLPCGGGIDLHFSQAVACDLVNEALGCFEARRPFSLALEPDAILLLQGEGVPPTTSSFMRFYRPPVRLLLIGAGAELVSLARLGQAAGMPVTCLSSDEACLAAAARSGANVLPLDEHIPSRLLDARTAAVFLFHDHERELPLLQSALRQPFFYLGALGSARTQNQRRQALARQGVGADLIERVRGPVGLFGPTRDAASLAVSILSEITALATQGAQHKEPSHA